MRTEVKERFEINNNIKDPCTVTDLGTNILDSMAHKCKYARITLNKGHQRFVSRNSEKNINVIHLE
jgi:hypothetical protein